MGFPIYLNHLKVARGARGLRNSGVHRVGGVEVSLDGALQGMLDLEEALGEPFHLQVHGVSQRTAKPRCSISGKISVRAVRCASMKNL